MSTWTPQQLAELHSEAALRQRMEDEGVNPGEPAEREAWEAGYDARGAEIEQILARVHGRWSRGGRMDDAPFLELENRLLPLEPGQSVQFRTLGRTRWLNGTFEGPVLNPDDPNRRGDVIVVSSTGNRVPVFLSSVRRRS